VAPSLAAALLVAVKPERGPGQPSGLSRMATNRATVPPPPAGLRTWCPAYAGSTNDAHGVPAACEFAVHSAASYHSIVPSVG
jgi:hypothetical protein